jgi:hypothetical protein
MTGEIGNDDGSAPDDLVGSRVANVVSLAAIESAYGDDIYGEDGGWAEEVADLGENR